MLLQGRKDRVEELTSTLFDLRRNGVDPFYSTAQGAIDNFLDSGIMVRKRVARTRSACIRRPTIRHSISKPT